MTKNNAVQDFTPFEVEARLIFNSSAPTAKKTTCLVTKISWLTLFKKIMAAFSENHMKHKYTLCPKCRVADYESRWYI
jgi:hypothetical protein